MNKTAKEFQEVLENYFSMENLVYKISCDILEEVGETLVGRTDLAYDGFYYRAEDQLFVAYFKEPVSFSNRMYHNDGDNESYWFNYSYEEFVDRSKEYSFNGNEWVKK